MSSSTPKNLAYRWLRCNGRDVGHQRPPNRSTATAYTNARLNPIPTPSSHSGRVGRHEAPARAAAAAFPTAEAAVRIKVSSCAGLLAPAARLRLRLHHGPPPAAPPTGPTTTGPTTPAAAVVNDGVGAGRRRPVRDALAAPARRSVHPLKTRRRPTKPYPTSLARPL